MRIHQVEGTWAITGTYTDQSGKRTQGRGTISISGDRQCQVSVSMIDGHVSTPAAPPGCFKGVSDHNESVEIGGPGIEHLRHALGRVTTSEVEYAKFERPEIRPGKYTRIDTVVVQWQLSHSFVLKKLASTIHMPDAETAMAIGVPRASMFALGRMQRKQDARLNWTLSDSVQFHIRFYEEGNPHEVTPDHSYVVPRQFRPVATLVYHSPGMTLAAADAIRDAATQDLEDLQSVLSFLSGHRVVWHRQLWRYNAPIGPSVSGRMILFGGLPSPIRDDYRADSVARWAHDELDTMLAEYQSSRDALGAAINLWLQAMLARDAMSRFLLLSTALESLKADWLARTNSGEIVEAKAFKQIVKMVRSCCRRGWQPDWGDKEARRKLGEGVGNLNRPSFRFALVGLFDEWGQSFVEREAFEQFADSFIKARNVVIHTGAFPDDADPVRLCMQAGLVVELTVLRRLGASVGGCADLMRTHIAAAVFG